ncbi:unnamed protein product [Nippostrongylus brasiliensis]|uniref:FYVE, RhoGEF and PH domain-containing protein 6 n=1 Tax=Nippostrongylus brasiliensis TaxID=27835 RepID=A0A0N4Y5G6_NIPBR|nr:unnamed protein product [Nippostrongylus brasiliensis]
MRMADDDSVLRVSVSTLREKLEEKLHASHHKEGPVLPPGIAVPFNSSVENNHQPPPLPPHRTKPELPSYSLRLSKPPIAPKPPHLSRTARKPTIFVSDSDEVANGLAPYVNVSSVDSTMSADDYREGDDIPGLRSSLDAQRPKSTISTTSTENGEAAELSDSDSDDGRQNGGNLLYRANSYLSGPGQVNVRRPSALCFNGDPALHDKIVDELKRQGIIRSSDRLMRNRAEKPSTDARQRRGRNSLQATDVPANESLPSKTPSTDTSSLTPSSEKPLNAASSRSSIVTTTSGEYEYVPDYNTGNEDENKRLKKLHYAANEFYSVQKVFLKYLRDMGEIYPEYVVEFGNRLGKELLARQGSHPHVVRQLQVHFEQLIRFHQLLLDEFASRLDNWSSLRPNMAGVILQYADFLKICKPFLMEKSRFVQELTQLRAENKDFDNATVAFEQKIFNRGVGAVVQQLDQVHQNFMRYKILMMSYNNYLEKDSEEQQKTLEAIAKLEKIAQSVNESMGLATNEELFKLYDRFQCHFDVFYPGRRLIRQGEVFKQTRKEPQSRYLVLFSDTLWICRVMSGFGSSGLFDMGRSYRIPIETVRTEINPHEDYEQELYVKSKYKSVILIMSSARERNQWQKDIDTAREEKRKYKRRMSEAKERQRRQSLNPLVLRSSLTEFSGVGKTTNESDMTITGDEENTINGDTLQNGSSLVAIIEILRADTVKPVWIPDDSSTKCLMEGCDTMFSFLNRRHHCRDCGWLICSACVGKAPLLKFQFKKEIVCPECYSKLEALCEFGMKTFPDNSGTLFPTTILLRGSDGIVRIRVPKGNSHEKKYVVVEPQSLFSPPINKGLKRDCEPCEQYVIHGFELREVELDSGGTQFELTHRNQILTDRKDHVISFRVEHEKSVLKWSTALRQGLGIE